MGRFNFIGLSVACTLGLARGTNGPSEIIVTHPMATGSKTSTLDMFFQRIGFEYDPPAPKRTSLMNTNARKWHSNGHVAIIKNPKGRMSFVPPMPGGCGTLEQVKTMARRYEPNCVLAVNAGYFDLTNGTYFGCIGNLVSDGRIVQTWDWSQRNVNFGIKNGKYVVGYITPEDIKAGGYEQLVSGLGWLVHEGRNYVEQGWKEAYTAAGNAGDAYKTDVTGRTAVGYDKDGHLIVVQVDGHSHHPSWGTNMSKLADILVELGAVEAINLDGGGSCAMVKDGVQVGYSSDQMAYGTLEPYYLKDSECPIGLGKGNHSMYQCPRAVSSILCIHETVEESQELSFLTAAEAGSKRSAWVAASIIGAVALCVGCLAGFALSYFARRQANDDGME